MRRAFKVFAIVFIGLALLMSVGCEDSTIPDSDRTVRYKEVPDRRTVQSESSQPDDVNYSVIATDIIPDIKRSLDVRLSKKVSEDTLRSIALELKSQDERHYERTFITYYMRGTSDAWAITDFNPDLVVHIIGLTEEDEQALTEKSFPSDVEIIGQWIDEAAGVVEEITIMKETGKLYLVRDFQDGGRLKEEVVESPSAVGRRFDKVEITVYDNYFVIDAGRATFKCMTMNMGGLLL